MEVLAESKRSRILEGLAQNPNAPEKILKEVYHQTVKMGAAEDGFSERAFNKIKMTLASNPNLPPVLVELLAYSSDPKTTINLLKNEHIELTPETIKKIADNAPNDVVKVLAAAAYADKVGPEIKSVLAESGVGKTNNGLKLTSK